MKCEYPDCFHCHHPDCIYDNPERSYKEEQKRETKGLPPKRAYVTTKSGLLKERRERVYRYIRDYFIENCFPPSKSEVMRALGLSSSTLYYDLKYLQAQGLIDISHYNSIKVNGYKIVKE